MEAFKYFIHIFKKFIMFDVSIIRFYLVSLYKYSINS